MKVAVVPAQITSVEDKITGNLGISQLILLIAPVFASSVLFILVPPFMGAPAWKIVLIVIVSLVFCVSAIRIKGKILLHWAIIILRYNSRPKFFIYNKNDIHLRNNVESKAKDTKAKTEKAERPKPKLALPQLQTHDLVALEAIVANPDNRLHFKTNKKGVLGVYISKVK